MPTLGSETKTIRFKPSDLGIIDSVMKKENTTFNNAVHLLIEQNAGVPHKTKQVPKTDYDSIAEMASLMKVTTEQLLSDMNDLLENGELYYSGGKLRNPMYEDFENRFNENEREKILEKVMREYGK